MGAERNETPRHNETRKDRAVLLKVPGRPEMLKADFGI